jgi:tetratricopeptide (TPR) repeat protein
MEIDVIGAENHNSLGISLAGQGRLEEAIASFRQAISIQTDFVDAHYNLGLALAELHQNDKAIGCFSTALDIDPDRTDALFNVAFLLTKEERLEEAIACYQDLLLFEPDSIEALLGLGSALQNLRMTDEAIECYQHLLTVQPENAEIHTLLGNLLLEQDRFDEAIASYQTALDINADLAGVDIWLRSALWCQEIQSRYTKDDQPQHFVLHVGCGYYSPNGLHQAFRNDRWVEIRFDINPDVKPDIIGSLTNMQAIENDAVDAIWSSHNIEHLYHHEVAIALSEFLRVLKPGGVVLITLPDIQKVAEHIAAGNLEEPLYSMSTGDAIAAIDILYGWGKSITEGNYYMAHRTAFTVRTLQEKLIAAGFKDVNVCREQFNLWAKAYK